MYLDPLMKVAPQVKDRRWSCLAFPPGAPLRRGGVGISGRQLPSDVITGPAAARGPYVVGLRPSFFCMHTTILCSSGAKRTSSFATQPMCCVVLSATILFLRSGPSPPLVRRVNPRHARALHASHETACLRPSHALGHARRRMRGEAVLTNRDQF